MVKAGISVVTLQGPWGISPFWIVLTTWGSAPSLGDPTGCLRLAHAPSQEILVLRSLGAMSLSEGDAQSFCDVRGRPDLVAFLVLERNAYG